MKDLSKKALVYCSICIAIATILSHIKLFEAPFGGTVTACSMLFIVLTGYWFGTFTGVLTGFVFGFLQLFLGSTIVHPIQLILDYLLAFSMLGLSGLFKGRNLYLAYVTGVFSRFVFSFISGFVFFSEYAGDQHPLVYSALYNLSYVVPEMIITLIIISVPSFKNAIKSVKLSPRNTNI